MALYDIPVADIDEARLDALVSNGVREGRQLDYRARLPDDGDRDRRHFLEDATSFANAVGGDIIYGVSERRDPVDDRPTGEAGSVDGLPNINLDARTLALSQLLRDAVAPPLTRVHFHEVSRGDPPPCLLLRIPRSWSGLHMIMFRQTYDRSYSRGPHGKAPLDPALGSAGYRFTLRERAGV